MSREAELVRGATYYLGSRAFFKGKAQPITPEDEEHLKENAIDPVMVDHKREYRQKFKFTDTEVVAAEKVTTRKRKSKAQKSE